MKYQEAIDHIQTVDSNNEYLSVAYCEADKSFYIYLLTSNDSDSIAISVDCIVEGGIPFSSEGTDDCLEISEVSAEISNLHFNLFTRFNEISGNSFEYVLFSLFPALPDPENICTQSEQLNFIKLAKYHIEHTWIK